MWIRNLDTGKWFSQTDELPKDYYDGLKQDIKSVQLYSKCLSGSVYIRIDNFDNIYDTLDKTRIGYYIDDFSANSGVPPTGPRIVLNRTNADLFYNRYLKENAFTIKNLFTPNKLIHTESDNIINVDIATTEMITNLSDIGLYSIIDGVKLLDGHKILIKDQISKVTLISSINPEDYFTNSIKVSKYYILSTDGNLITYYYYNKDNGIYTLENNRLVRTNYQENYDKSYKLKVFVKYGEVNHDKQFHLERLKNFYYPIDGENVSFVEGDSWILRHRLDYNNVLDLNYYDVIRSESTLVYSKDNNFTYSIPTRLITVGEFGSIINSQFDMLNLKFTSNIMKSDYKVDYRSICETNDYYWICGDEGILLKIYKPDFSIERIDLGIYSRLNSIIFFNNLNGFVVGDYNRIFYTDDGGKRWNVLDFPEYDAYSFNKIIYKDVNTVYIAGTNGLFLELTRNNNIWSSYKRYIYKNVNGDKYVLSDDIYDILSMKWVFIKSTSFSKRPTIGGGSGSGSGSGGIGLSNLLPTLVNQPKDFADGLVFNFSTSETRDNYLKITLSNKYPENIQFPRSSFNIFVKLKDSTSQIYSDVLNSSPTEMSFFKESNGKSRYEKIIELPIDPATGNIFSSRYTFEAKITYDYDVENDTILSTPNVVDVSFNFSTTTSDIILLSTLDKVVVYDTNKTIFDSKNDFVYIEFDKKTDEIRCMAKSKFDDRIFIGANSAYSFTLGAISNLTGNDNFTTTSLETGPDVYLNKIIAKDQIYYAGNESLYESLRFSEFGNSNNRTKIDDTFASKYKARLLFLDYDIASKLNFFTDLGEYRLPSSAIIPQSELLTPQLPFIELSSLSNQQSWIDYYRDSEKTFEYYSTIGDVSKIQFSTKFKFNSNGNNIQWSVNNNKISGKLEDISKFAPSLKFKELSDYYIGQEQILSSTRQLSTQPSTLSDFDLLINKNLIIFKRDQNDVTEIGEVLRIESDIVDCNLIVNKIVYYLKRSGQHFERVNSIPTLGLGDVLEKYIYCFNTFNQNIVNNLISYNGNISIKNLNKYNTIDNLIDRFNNHPLGIGYSLTKDNNINIVISPRLNNKTAYYSLAFRASTSETIYTQNYKESFLNFGFGPTYNLLDVLQRIDSNIFTPSKKLHILPGYTNLPATEIYRLSYYSNGFGIGLRNLGLENSSSNFSPPDDNSINVIRDSFFNKLIVGKNMKFYWDTFLIWTFVDVTLNNSDKTEQLLITAKYYDDVEGWYIIEFHKKLKLSNTTITKINIVSRNTLSQISQDLQSLNNIQRPSTKSFFNGTPQYLTNLESDIKFKFPTDSYLKAFVSDYEIQEKITGIIYTDYEYQLALNIINLSSELEFSFGNIQNQNGKVAYTFTSSPEDKLKVGDLIYVKLEGDTVINNPQYEGYQTIISISGVTVVTSMDFGRISTGNTIGKIRFMKRDSFLNYQPIDLFNISSDKKPKKSIEILPEMVKLSKSTFSLKDVNVNKFKLMFVDGLFLQEVEDNYSWFLQAETSNAVIGKNESGLVWYSGVWRCGRWFGGTWVSGEWLTGDWYDGEWYSSRVRVDVLSAQITNVNNNFRLSKWQNGRWFGGKWYGGTWFNGRRYGGDWYDGVWFNGIWNDGNWFGGNFQGGIWVLGKWSKGNFNCDSKPSYWLDGSFESGDFENGIWYNGQFGNEQGNLSRFGTKSLSTRISVWHGGKWLNGEFHSSLNKDSITNQPLVSDIHTLSVWRTGIWLGGDFYGGIAYNIDFRGGTWHGGILEEIKVIGIDPLGFGNLNTNAIYVYGIFKFNPGDTIYILDDYSNTSLSSIGSNDKVGIYRINKIEEDESTSTTKLFLNYNLYSLRPQGSSSGWGVGLINLGITKLFDVDTELRLVSHFVESNWKSGLWTNGYFESGKFESGIWYNGVFEGIWGS